ncbi:hypothetical protein DOM21_02020 [Bacteriovorax stolpii]|uniref:Uncharacterized protein n=1 Tax=Bacteriovorax stolpii TaxID=960 RepID=A0A2K9NW71_BACTC|nr:hypothetical protein [Bacteriovorax stolpii]AUN99756.1 hypothetical protein C0V70_16905 [Bacteriovorax stolpii]QDK40250.1 hypothetical protein DOM21_02020 [Bacteriovorax stolpii]TDP54357.1 hypothetical protein C8D79_1654 [Bacteriovorax stolpii]BDT29939.1 hypothetical protein BHI3_34050 [Bacteriovorax sp. HI3]
MKILLVLSLMALTTVAEAKIGLKVSLIYKKGIGKGFFLSTEQHSIQSVDEKEHILIQMKNGIKADISAFYVQSVHEYGPSGFVRIKGDLYNINGKIVKTFNEPNLDIYLGDTKTITHVERNEEQIEIVITPVSL